MFGGRLRGLVGAPDPMFRVLSVRTAPVHAALASFPEPQYRNAADVNTGPFVEPKVIEPPRPHVTPRYAQLPDLSSHYRHDIDAACRSCVSPYCLRLYHCGER